MKVYSLELKEFYETFSIKDWSDKDGERFEGLEILENNWEEKSLKITGKGKKTDIAF